MAGEFDDVLPPDWVAGDDSAPVADVDLDEYELFLKGVEEEWPPERIWDYVLSRKRRGYLFFTSKMKELEGRNAEDRRRGVPYSKRREYGGKIDALERLVAAAEREGRALKAEGLKPARAYLSPDDMAFVREHGFARHLNLRVM
jgi:hypothetical protein